ncbi:enoyl-CoA hydratase/isomerase family protein [Aeromicrobium sp. IC_218]|nr:enoyl-CoA hydratase/isomerase family protein [Aeromicrobium sp. IC_218]
MRAMSSSVTRHGRVLRLVLSDPAAGNALDFARVEEAKAALEQLDPAETGAVLLAADGPHFSTGGNVHAFAAAADRHAHVHDAADGLHDFVRVLDGVGVPVVAGVPGWAAGAGMSLVLLADVRIGGTRTRLKPAYPGIGYTPDGGMTHTLARQVGEAKARELVLTNATIDAETAERLGILSRVVPDDDVVDEALAAATTLAEGPTEAYGRIRALFREGRERTLSDQLDAESDSIADSSTSPAGIEGVDAFVAGRPAQWPSATS